MCNTCGCKKAEDISKDIFGNKTDAMDRAEELGSNHTHSHKINGDMIHMPFKTHKEYQENMGAEEYSSSELEQMDEGSIQGVLFSVIKENGLEIIETPTAFCYHHKGSSTINSLKTSYVTISSFKFSEIYYFSKFGYNYTTRIYLHSFDYFLRIF